MRLAFPTRQLTIALVGAMVVLPMSLLVYQSALDGAFFFKTSSLSLSAYAFVLTDAAFWSALRNSFVIAAAMTVIAVPLGALMAFLVVRTDLPFARALEPIILIPMLISSIVLAIGYVVSIGPVGFYSIWFREAFGFVPWNLYSPVTLYVIAGLVNVPPVFLFVSSALKNLGSDLEEAARTSGGGSWRVAFDISLPMVMPALLYSAGLVFLSGIGLFGLPLVLGVRSNFNVLATYLHDLSNQFGTPSYHLMAAVSVCFIAITFPLVMLQRHLLRFSERYVSVRGKASRQKPVPLGAFRWVAFGGVVVWLFVCTVLPISGIALRSVVSRWGANVELLDVLTAIHYNQLFSQPVFFRAIVNSVLIGVVGGAAAVAVYAALAIAIHRRRDGATRFVDYIVLVPNTVPGLVIGLVFLWVFLFFPPLTQLRSTLFSIWLAYTVVWLAYGIRLISSSLTQVGPELEEAARTLGASRGKALRDITLPLVRHGLLAAWVLVFMMFESEYSAGVYLLTSGTEVVGSLLVAYADGGSIGMLAALSVVNVLLVGAGLAVALRWGMRVHG